MRTLDPDDVVIRDDSGVIGLAGTMGGLRTEIDDDSTDLVLEAARFVPEPVARTARRHRLSSEASRRFERGVDPLFVVPGLELATQMVLDLCGGEASEMVVAGQIPDTSRSIAYRPSRVLGLAGLERAG